MSDIVHDTLPCGIEYGVVHLPDRHIVSYQIRMLAGVCLEPHDKLGLARVLSHTIDMGTQQRSGREMADAFDAIGASHGGGTGRETTTFSCTTLPAHFERSLELHAEFLRTATFPEDVVDVHIDLQRQELIALEDDASALADKLIGERAYGPPLGRHALGDHASLDRITRADIHEHWKFNFAAGRMLVTVAGPIEPERVADLLQRLFEGFGPSQRSGRDPFAVNFTPGMYHQHKELEQEQIGICWPGVDATHDAFATQQILLGVLSGGMSGRLFTEVREKQGLVYWVSAWQETPRGTGMLFMGASTMPDRCDQTYRTLLREVERVAEDLEQDELDRAVTGLAAHLETSGDSTRARCAELANDIFFFGRPVSHDEKIGKLEAVTIDSIREYLRAYPRDRLCVVTLGPRPLADNAMPIASETPTAPASPE